MQSKFVPLAWGCALPVQLHGSYPRLPQFPLRLHVDLRFGQMGDPCPLSYECIPVSSSALRGRPFLPYAEADIAPNAGANLQQMERELESPDADEAGRLADAATVSSARAQHRAPADAEAAFRASYVEQDAVLKAGSVSRCGTEYSGSNASREARSGRQQVASEYRRHDRDAGGEKSRLPQPQDESRVAGRATCRWDERLVPSCELGSSPSTLVRHTPRSSVRVSYCIQVTIRVLRHQPGTRVAEATLCGAIET